MKASNYSIVFFPQTFIASSNKSFKCVTTFEEACNTISVFGWPIAITFVYTKKDNIDAIHDMFKQFCNYIVKKCMTANIKIPFNYFVINDINAIYYPMDSNLDARSEEIYAIFEKWNNGYKKQKYKLKVNGNYNIVLDSEGFPSEFSLKNHVCVGYDHAIYMVTHAGFPSFIEFVSSENDARKFAHWLVAKCKENNMGLPFSYGDKSPNRVASSILEAYVKERWDSSQVK